MAYNEEEISKAIELYKQLGSMPKVILTLGYPTRRCLYQWIKNYEETGEIKVARHGRAPQFTQEQIDTAINYYLRNGRSATQTIQALGYPGIVTFRKWVRKYVDKSSIPHAPTITHSEETKLAAVKLMRNPRRSVIQIARQFGVTRTTLYAWEREYPSISSKSIKVRTRIAEKTKSLSKDPLAEAMAKVSELDKQVSALELDAKQLQKEVEKLRMQKDILQKCAELLKKATGINPNGLKNKEKAIVIGALRNLYRLKDLLKEFGISKSSYCYQAKVLAEGYKYARTSDEIRNIFIENQRCYGYRRIKCGLQRRGITLSEKVVRRLMKEQELKVYQKRIRKYSSYAGEITPEVANHLKRDFHADKPNQKWLTDITEFTLADGKVYLSPIIDCYDGLVVAYSIGTTPSAELANSMLRKAIATLQPGEHPIIHSDRGCHYRWPGWIELTEAAGLVRSMSKKGCSPDNSACEGFFGRLKNEMFYCRTWVNVSSSEFIKILDEYLKWYCEKRVKLSMGGMSPVEFRESRGIPAWPSQSV